MASNEKSAAGSVIQDQKCIAESNLNPSEDEVNGDYSVKDKALLRKLDLRLLPALTLLYLLSFLDRSNGVPAFLTWKVVDIWADSSSCERPY